jgi:DNA replication and repair protein RecF
MILAELKIHHLRAISSAHLKLNARFNFIVGPNGSGKTSLLEALYLLSSGHSFRSRELSSIISFDHASLTVFARSESNETVSIQKSKALPTQIKLNNHFCSATSQLAYALPCQIIDADLSQLIDSGSSLRRSLIDWGLFHVKREYHLILKEYKRVLKQRNALLKQTGSYSSFIPWDKLLSDLSEQLDLFRSAYFSEFIHEFNQVLASLSDNTLSTIEYYKGWDKKNTGKSLSTILSEQFSYDVYRQFTQYGAHHADLFIHSNRGLAKQIVSRGQKKIILLAIKIAQGKILQGNCLYLIDDLPAELDLHHQNKVLSYLNTTRGQFIITSSTPFDTSAFLSDEYCFFSTNNGCIK